jgi:hypothetical protein
MSESPSAVVYNGLLYVFHQGFGGNGQLWYTYSADGADWDPDTLISGRFISGSPSAVVYNGVLYVFYQGGINTPDSFGIPLTMVQTGAKI